MYLAATLTVIVIGVIIKQNEVKLPTWVYYPALFLVIIAYATIRVLGKSNARRIRREPDFDKPVLLPEPEKNEPLT